MWLEKAINEAPYLRDPYMERALLEYELEDWEKVEFYCKKALEIKKHPKTYINEIFSWNHTVYDLLSLSYFQQNNFEKALENINKALNISQDDERLLRNKEIIEKHIKRIDD